MMTSQPLAPIIVENQVINWKVVSGTAVGVHKYTKTHVSSSGGEYPTYSSIVEIIVECSIHKDDGEEVPVKLSTLEQTLRAMNGKDGFEEIRLREGQLISVIGGYTYHGSSNWLIFINHDDKKWYWLNSYSTNWGRMWAMYDIPQIGKFLDDLGICDSNLFKISLFLWFIMSPLIVWLFISILPYPFSFWLLSFVGLGLVSWFIRKKQVDPSRQIVKLQIAEMARSLL